MKVAFTLKQASVDDFNNLRLEGTVYFLKSLVSGKFDPRPYYIKQNMNIHEFNQLYLQGSVYVPVDFEEQIN